MRGWTIGDADLYTAMYHHFLPERAFNKMKVQHSPAEESTAGFVCAGAGVDLPGGNGYYRGLAGLTAKAQETMRWV